jgi:histidinol-phosphate aminotransferase
MKSITSRRNVLKAGTLLGLTSLLPETGNASPSSLLTSKGQKITYPSDMKAKLVGHENHWGASKKSVKAVSETLFQTNYYPTFPDNLVKQLTEKIAKEEKIAPEQVLLGCGSTENLMSAAFRYGPNGQLITSELTWGPDRAFVNSIQEHGGEWLKVPVKNDLSQDLDALAAAVTAKTSILYVVNPNFWTAHHIAVPEMKSFINKISGKVPLIVDEAYIEYSGNYDDISMVSSVREGKMLVVSRTFSKVYGLPGLRLGYMMGHPDMIKEIKKFSMNGKGLSKPALAAGIASYRDSKQPK